MTTTTTTATHYFHHLHHHHHHSPKPKSLFRISAQIKNQNPSPSNTSDNNKKIQFVNRRSLLFSSSSSALSLINSFPFSPLSFAEENATPTAPPPSPPPPPPPTPDTTITDRIFMDFSICPSFRNDRNLGDELITCQDNERLGRVVFGLYGKVVPSTVAHFKAMCTGTAGSSYKGTLVQKILPGQYMVAGRQGRRNKGDVRPPTELARNLETIDSKAFILGHSRPGVLSLCLSENDDDDDIKLDPNYRNVEFLVTTGPGPCPDLDNRNIVFGAVLEGLDVVTSIASIPTYKPAERIRQLNDLAEFFGDERAQNARTIWNRPLKTIYISDCGELKVAKPSLSPTLP